MYDKSQVGLESAQEGIQLSSAIYSAFRSKNGLTKEQLSQIKNILENHKLLNDLTGESKAQSAKIEKALLMLNSKMSQVDKMYFEARAVMADHVKPKSKIFRPGVS